MSQIKEKIANPLKFYRRPSEVEQDNELSTDEKIKLLQNWLDDIDLQLNAESENMPSYDETRFYVAEVENLLEFYLAKLDEK